MKSIRLVSFAALATALLAAESAGCAAPSGAEGESSASQSSALEVKGGTLPPKLDKPVTYEGTLTRIWVGKTDKERTASGYRYFLKEKGTKGVSMRAVSFPSEVLKGAGGYGKILGRTLKLTGSQFAIDWALIVDNLAVLEEWGPPPEAKDPLVGTKRWLTIPCRFSDVPSPDPHGLGYFEGIMGTAAPGAGDFFAKASNGRLSLESTVLDWVDMPNPANQYFDINGQPRIDNIIGECLTTAFASVDFNGVDGFSLVYSHNIGVGVSGGSLPMDFGSGTKDFGFTLLQPSDFVNQEGVVRGVGLGMTMTFSGSAPMQLDSPWDFMSLGYGTTNGITCKSLTQSFGCAGVLPLAEQAVRSGWVDGSRVGSVPSDGFATFDLDFPTSPQVDGHKSLVRLPIDSQHWYTIEARDAKAGTYDVGIPRTEVLIHSMDGKPVPLDASDQEKLEGSTRLRLLGTLNGGTSFVSDALDIKIDAVKKSFGYTVTVARGPRLDVGRNVNALVTGAGIDCGFGSHATCSTRPNFNTSVTLTAYGINGYGFKQWSNCPMPSGNTCTVTMDRSRSVSAVVEAPPEPEPCVCLPTWPVYKCQQICGGF